MSSKPKKSPLLPADPIGAKFCQYFPHPWNFIYAPVPQHGKPCWLTETRYPLQPRNLWQQYNDPERLVGLRFGPTTRYGLLDIDQGSPNHPKRCPGNYQKILHILEDIGIVRTLTVQSSPSGGLHVYFFLPEAVPSFALACALQQRLSDEGYWVEDGRLEIFPNVKSYTPGQPSNYKAHRLPLQSGSVLLDDDLGPLPGDIKTLLHLADTQSTCQDIERLQQVMTAALEAHKKSKYHPEQSNRAQQWCKDLEEQMNQGWTDSGQTNQLLKTIGIFGRVFQGITRLQDLGQYIQKQAQKLPGFKQHCHHIKDLPNRARDWANSIFGYYSPYCSHPARGGTYKQTLDNPQPNSNQRRQQEARDRIMEALRQLEKQNALPQTASERALALQQTAKTQFEIGISKQTLYKKENLPLWHPDHQPPQPSKPEQPQNCATSTQSPPSPETPAETPEAAPEPESSDPTPYEGFMFPSGAPAPQKAGGAMSFNPEKEAPSPATSRGRFSKTSETPDSSGCFDINCEEWRLLKLTLKLANQVQRQIACGGDFYPGKNATSQERQHQQKLAKMFLYWESGESALVAQVRQWLQTSPDLTPQEWDLFF
ncbi:hypothetical protein [Oscillatoria sp. FACHB-1406]|uniref:hypothetical protein n=1 Tax=Oscillatoria sp. FACHB-1406 TaxID=2692846 RepID=UPI0016899683|nr:hypothetical protein [Oscillatoria sp. FACHB-1406]MBD2580155.1 hypothetical protein [Oscillatoria sp. FACHB-1406]